MGIPIYYRKILEQNPECVSDTLVENIDNLFIDFNAFIYSVIPCVNIELSTKDFETELINKTIIKLIELVQLVNPSSLLYIAMDGPAPKAKMIQQRSRRYKTLKEIEFIKELEKKYKIKIKRSKWNKNAISPGTVFMSKLSKEIIKHIKNNSFKGTNEIKIIFSDHCVAGEGEHKLMNYLKDFNTQNRQKNTVIYSPDADMIVLSILSEIPNIFILRTDEYEHISYLNIDLFKNKIELSFNEHNINRVLKDYSFLTFLCGNDFVHSVSFLKIKDNGLKELIKIYESLRSVNKSFLLSIDNKINNMFLLDLIKELKEIENEKLKTIQKKRHQIMKKDPKILKESENGKEPWQIELNRFQHEEYYSPLNPKWNPNIFNKINYFDTDWVTQYNNYFFKDININDVCLEYYKSLQFCTNYYFNKDVSWNYYYKYRTSPTMNDFYNFLKQNIELNIVFNSSRPYNPFEQLLMILPNSSHSLLPKQLRSLESDSFFEIDIVNGTKFIYSEAILPDIEDSTIIDSVKSCKFSLEEIKRNTIKDNPFVSH